MKIKEFYEPVFRASVYIILTPDQSKVEKWAKKRFGKNINLDLENLAGGVFSLSKRNKKDEIINWYYILWLKHPDEKDYLDDLVHEVSHLVDQILFDCQIKHTVETTEIFAYYSAYWFRKILKLMKL